MGLALRPEVGVNEFNTKRLIVRFAPQGSSAPTLIAGRDVTVSRVAAGQFRVTVTDGGLGRLVGFETSCRFALQFPFQVAGGVWSSSNRTFDIFVSNDCALQTLKASDAGAVLQADGAAGTATAEKPIGVAVGALPVGSVVTLVPAAALTANDTNFADVLVQKRTAGGAATTVADFQTKITGGTGNWTAWSPVTVATTVAVAAGDALTWSITKTAGGVVVPAFALNIFGAAQDIPANADNEICLVLTFGSDQEL